jgi:F1F0 ATPase subunit 2
MMMHELIELALAGVAGTLLGAVFFGGLWWTVRECIVTQRSTLWLLGSWLLRMGIVLTGFYFIGHEHWQRLLLALLGFVIARLIVRRLIQLPMAQSAQAQEAGHAP